MHYNIHALKNGLRVILAPMQDTQTATVIVMCGTGSRHEDERENGLAHFLEHMFFKGTKKRKTARAISEELDGVGAHYNAFTSKERTAYYAKVSGQYLDTALDVISDIFLNSQLPAKEIEKERGAIIQEIDMYEDMPMRTVSDVFEGLIFGGEPLGRTILGPKENIRTFSRKDFAEYLKKHYAPNNTVVCVAGSFSEKKVLTKIKKEFGHLVQRPTPSLIKFTGTQDAPRVAIKEKKTDQTQVILGVPAYPYLHKDEYALEVLTSLMGSGMSSRLFLEVREKRGLAYSVSAWTDKYPDTGYFGVQAGVEHGKLQLTIETILAELRKVKKNLVSPVELAKVKAHIQGSLVLGLESSDAIATNAATGMINLGRVRTLEEIKTNIARVTSADLQRVARDIFKTEKLNLAVIGPHANEAKLISLLRI
jgi:predicted Zn-dependent peptidase